MIGRLFVPVHPLLEAPVKKQIFAFLAAVTLAGAVGACSSTPTASTPAETGEWQADTNTTPSTDSTGARVPNIFGSGN
jgi:hypothetical protein